jgi:hypothetical protein
LTNRKKEPWMKFYPSDWRGDPRLRMCSIGARGLWMEMLCIMHEAEPYGHMVVGNVPVTNRQLASLAAISQTDCMKFMAELESSRVYSRQEGTGIIYSRRMVRDKAKAERDRENGKGGGNPKLKGGDNGGVNPPDNHPDKAQKLEARDQIDDVDDGARTPGLPPSSPEMALTEELLVIAGHDLSFWPPGWCGAPVRVRTWLNSGWSRETIVAVAKSVMARKRDGPPSSVKYFENAIAAETARLSAPLPKFELSHVQETQPSLRLLRPVKGGGGFASIAAKLRANDPAGRS